MNKGTTYLAKGAKLRLRASQRDVEAKPRAFKVTNSIPSGFNTDDMLAYLGSP